MAIMPLLPRRRAAGIGIRNPDGSWTSQEEMYDGKIINTPSVDRPPEKKSKKSKKN